MDVPDAVREALGDEDAVAHVPLRGEDAVYVTPTRTLVYTGEGLLSEAGVEAFGHDAERIVVSEGRRKATLTLDYGLDGERSFSVPVGVLDDVLHPVVAGVLSAAGVTGPGETVTRTYRFSELTLVVTSARVVKHIGDAVWDEDYEEVEYEDVVGIDSEEGNVATQLVLQTPTRTERIKTPADRARDVREHVEGALFEYYGVSSRSEFERVASADDAETAEAAEADAEESVDFADSGLDPLSASPATDSDRVAPADTRPDRPTNEGNAGAGTDATRARETTDAEGNAGRTGGAGTTDGTAGGDAGATDATAGGDADAPEEWRRVSDARSEAGVSAGRSEPDEGVSEADLAERLAAMEEAIERQEAVLAEQRALLEDLSRALSRRDR